VGWALLILSHHFSVRDSRSVSRTGGCASPQALRLFRTCEPVCWTISFFPRGSPLYIELRRRTSSFIYVCGLSAALTQEAVSQMRARWVVGKQSRSERRLFPNQR
jgi:hypothetical protein